MTVAADTRAAVREHPFLETALRAGVVNYTAAARFLTEGAGDLGGDREAVAAALRRYADELDDYEDAETRASVSMRSGIAEMVSDEEAAGDGEALLSVGEATYAADGGDATGVVVAGDVDADTLARVLGRLRTAGVTVRAAAGTDSSLVVVVDRRDGANAVRAVEDVL